MFINKDYILSVIENAKNATELEVQQVLEKARRREGLDHKDIAILLHTENEEYIQEVFKIAGEIKQEIYGNRVVIFAPLYVSDYCVNNCTYCGYKRDNKFPRRRLTKEEIVEETKILQDMGHKRIALEAGEDPVNCDINYILDALDTVYSVKHKNGSIRRINVNIAATTVDNYKRLKDANIGTYILFQETYDQDIYEKVHPKCLKGDYEYHLTAFDRAMEAGIDDVGGGVLFGLADYKYEVISLMIHNEHLEERFGVGFHTISVPRLKKAEGMNLQEFPHIITDEEFKKVVGIIRLAVPFTGIILSTRETVETRKELLNHGISQISSGSCTGVNGYKEHEDNKVKQFELSDERSPLETLKWLLENKYLPSYCTACYRSGRTGDRFMRLAKSGQIHNVCSPNAIMTLLEFSMDYGDDEIKKLAFDFIAEEVEKIENEKVKALTKENIEKIKNGQRDLFL